MFYPQTDVRFVYGGRLRGVRAPREDVRDGHHVVEVDLGGAERVVPSEISGAQQVYAELSQGRVLHH